MAYEPTLWERGDVVTVAKLNKIEEGIVEAAQTGSSGGGVFLVHIIAEEDELADPPVIPSVS